MSSDSFREMSTSDNLNSIQIGETIQINDRCYPKTRNYAIADIIDYVKMGNIANKNSAGIPESLLQDFEVSEGNGCYTNYDNIGEKVEIDHPKKRGESNKFRLTRIKVSDENKEEYCTLNPDDEMCTQKDVPASNCQDTEEGCGENVNNETFNEDSESESEDDIVSTIEGQLGIPIWAIVIAAILLILIVFLIKN